MSRAYFGGLSGYRGTVGRADFFVGGSLTGISGTQPAGSHLTMLTPVQSSLRKVKPPIFTSSTLFQIEETRFGPGHGFKKSRTFGPFKMQD